MINGAQVKIQEQLKKLGLKIQDMAEKAKKAIEEAVLKLKLKSADIAKFIKDYFSKNNGAKASGNKKSINLKIQSKIIWLALSLPQCSCY